MYCDSHSLSTYVTSCSTGAAIILIDELVYILCVVSMYATNGFDLTADGVRLALQNTTAGCVTQLFVDKIQHFVASCLYYAVLQQLRC